jgi:ribosomal protein S20
MRKAWKIVAIVTMVAVLGVATVAAVAYAQDATTGSSAVWDFGQKVKEAIAEALGISVEKYEETVTAAQTQVLEEAVSEGVLTEEEADRMQQHLASDDRGRAQD